MRTLQDYSLRGRVLAAAALAIMAGFGVMIAVIANNVYSDARERGIRRATEQADAYVKQVEARFDQAYSVPRHLALAMQVLQGPALPQRKQLDQMVQRFLERFPEAVGLWMLWEPNALDGRDDQYRLAWPFHDPTGRYMPYFSRAGKEVKQDIGTKDEEVPRFPAFRHRLRDYQPPYEQPGWGDYYLRTKQRNRDTVTEPYPFTVQGQPVLESSLVVAIQDGSGRFVGASGIDLSLAGLQSQIGAYRPFGVGQVTLLSNQALYVVAGQPERLGKPLEAQRLPAGALAKLKAGQGQLLEQGGQLEVWRPVRIGQTGQNWVLGVSIPIGVLLADANRVRNQAVLVGAVATVAILLLLGILLSALTAPLQRLAMAMEALSAGRGDFNRRLPVSAQDEIGRTSEAFNRMMTVLAQQALHDQLTGALNRHGLAEAFTEELSRVERGGGPLCVALLDLDNFKRLNDQLGHQAGDAALAHLVTVARSAMRPTDRIARYGGEEFLILLPNTLPDEAMEIVQRVQQQVREQAFQHHGRAVPITFSAGVALFRSRESAEAAVARADAAMYRAKQAGKDRVFSGD